MDCGGIGVDLCYTIFSGFFRREELRQENF